MAKKIDKKMAKSQADFDFYKREMGDELSPLIFFKMELKQIPTDKILANFYQPREKFDKEHIKELAESILSNGLINPITVRKWKDKFMIVAGERRWRAHKIANLKTISAFIKEYKSEGQFMIESLIENLHREDLTPQEASKFVRRIMKEEKISTVQDLSKRLSIGKGTIGQWFDADEIRKKLPKTIQKKVSPTIIYETKGLPEKERVELIKKAVDEDFGGSKMRQLVSEVKEKKKFKEEYGTEPLEDVEYERTTEDVAGELLDDFSGMTDKINELVKMNYKDLSKDRARRLLTSSGVLIFTTFPKLLKFAIQTGAKPDERILRLIKLKK